MNDRTQQRPPVSLWPASWAIEWREKDTHKFVLVYDVDPRDDAVFYLYKDDPNKTDWREHDQFMDEFVPCTGEEE